MCITFLKIAKSRLDKYKLILLNNRDEQLLRPTLAMHWHDGILSGVDEQDVARGTWTGLNEQGRIGMMLSITQPQSTKYENAPSRGGIVNRLLNSQNTYEMLESLKKEAHKYNGFQLVHIAKNSSGLFDVSTLTNREVENIEVCKWENEFQVISNSPITKPYKKTQYGKKLIEERLADTNEMNVDEVFEKLLDIAKDSNQQYPDEQLQLQTQNTHDYNRPLSAIFIKYPEGTRQYGTRCHTLITIDQNDEVNVLERRLLPEENKWDDTKFQFKLHL